ncbi:2-methylcitrate dehydratase PrpD [Saccharata proteae CBS 121410]|uniref:2-methylcitrate dehydratase PrpD n=1 Tax=Saccharata proteae CBS 121410 TaxID=1314787 RepID=A0A9P4M0J0_9PEZI|nr:2-methylcitrate dehydratase PrpD [Saccharata proteae CBS 121410]
MATKALATWSVDLNFNSLPDEVVQQAADSFMNWAGCAIGGCNHKAAIIARKSIQPFSGPPTSTILGTNESMDAQSAALLNGISSHVHDYDDTHPVTIIHPTGPVASALLAVAEWKKPVTGEKFLVALVAGIEAECKLGLAVWPDHYDVGWHITSTTGAIGAAVAVSKILDLDVEATQNAIGIAASQVTGLREQFGSMTKSFHPGRAAQNGLLAAVMASNGYDSSHQILEAERGWANVVSKSNELDKQIQSLGKTWEIKKNEFKQYACGVVLHSVMDACRKLYANCEACCLGSQDFTLVTLTVNPLVLELTGKKNPRTELERKFSVYWCAATMLTLGRVTPEIIEVKVDEEKSIRQAHVHVYLEGNDIPNVYSSTESLGDDPNFDLKEKFLDQSEELLGLDTATEIADACEQLEKLADVAELAALMRPKEWYTDSD